MDFVLWSMYGPTTMIQGIKHTIYSTPKKISIDSNLLFAKLDDDTLYILSSISMALRKYSINLNIYI